MSALGIDEVNLPEEEVKQLKELLLEFADVFALDDTELGSTDRVEHTIKTGLQSNSHQDGYHLHCEGRCRRW